MRRLLPLVLILAPMPARAADRTVSVASFSRVRVEGPFVVRVDTGGSPRAQVNGDRAIIERVEVTLNGDTLVVRMGGPGWGERPALKPSGPVTIVLGTPRLAGVALVAGAQVTTGAMKADRVDLSVTGAGKLTVGSLDAGQLVATVVGAGSIGAAGKSRAARLMVNGPGTIVAPGLVAGELVTRVEGTGEVTVTARYTAQVTSSGLGRVTVLGKPKCIVRAAAGGPVTCG